MSRAEVQDYFAENGSWEGEVVQFNKNGREVFVHASVSLMRNEMGVPIGVVAVNRDITEQKLAEDTLRVSEALFRGFMQSATDGFTLLDENMRYVEVNDSWLQILGLERDDVIGKHILELFPRLKWTGRDDAYRKVMKTGEPVDFYSIESASGPNLFLDVSAFKTGDLLGLVVKDVSDRVRHQRRLQTLHGHAAALSSMETLDEVAKITRDYLNQVIGFKLGGLGFVEGDILAHRYLWGAEPTMSPLIPLNGPGVSVEAINTGTTINIGDVRENPLFINGFAETNTISELAVPIKVSGKPIGIINLESEKPNAFTENDQRLVETLASHIASAYTKIKYNERLSALHSFAFELDNAESVKDVVETSFRIMKEILGFQFSSFQLLEKEGLVSVGTSDSTNLGTVLPLSGKGVTTRAAREARTILLGDVHLDPDYLSWSTKSRSELAVPIMGEDKVLGVLNIESLQIDAFNEDDARLMEVLTQNVGATLNRIQGAEEKRELERKVLAEQLRVEHEQELGRLKNQFISTATHELRTPVTSILGYIELVLSYATQDLPETIRKDLEVVLRNANRLVTLTNDLLDVQRITSGRFEVQLEQVNIVNTLNDVVEELLPLFEGKKQKLLVNAPRELIIDVDEVRISQLFINLLRNANKFTPEEGSITITVEPDENHVLVAVMDTGIGLSEEEIGRLFKPFPGIRHGFGISSTGLGLAICKGVIDMHHGNIWAESEGTGKGSTFSFTIPLK